MKKMILTALVAVIALLIFVFFYNSYEENSGFSQFQKDHYSQNIQPIFDSKCVACHSCYNSPCQLNLSSYEGLVRGGNKTNIYDFPKFKARKPTRLYIDAHTQKEWQELGFYPVTSNKNSILKTFISDLDGVESGKQKTYSSETSRVCVSDLGEINKFIDSNPAGRMPYGFTRLNDKEIQTITNWEENNFSHPNLKKLESEIVKANLNEIKKWEQFFNNKNLKNKIVSRYIYEHLFLAHLYFESSPQIFFRLVRSKTETGDIKEISTSYPFDSPGSVFFYRFRPVTNTITHKSHIPFGLTVNKLNQWERMFIKTEWKDKPQKMPAYGREGANPFKTFENIPVQARYQFFLDEANYHIMTFIKGPVCRGQTALNVINDHFWVMFIDPKKDILVNHPDVYDQVSNAMKMPAEIKDDLNPFLDFREKYWTSLHSKYKRIQEVGVPDSTWIWNGNKDNNNSLITVFRHFDSAQVLKGLRGRRPKTIWAIDYQVFESIYYNLTAGYNVFGPLLHQINSRLYMEMNRLASEDMFITFLDPKLRPKTRLSWNQAVPDKKESKLKKISDLLLGDASKKIKFEYTYPGFYVKSEKQDGVSKDSLIDELLQKRFSQDQILGVHDLFEPYKKELRHGNKDSHPLKPLLKLNTESIIQLPDTIFIKFKGFLKSKAYTLIHNKEHYNVSMMFLEQDLRQPNKDYVDIIEGIAGSYANLYLVFDSDTVGSFVQEMNSAKGPNDKYEVLRKYSVSRSDKKFWEYQDWFSKQSTSKLTNESGVIDLNRYIDI